MPNRGDQGPAWLNTTGHGRIPLLRRAQCVLNGGRPYGSEMESWLENSPGLNVHRVQTPLRIEAIGRSSAIQEWEFHSGLKILNKPVEMVYIPDGAHILVKPAERVVSQQGNVDWFRSWLQGHPLSEMELSDTPAWPELKRLNDDVSKVAKPSKLEWFTAPSSQ